MNQRNISFWYFRDSHVQAYKENVLNYLKENSRDFEKVGFPYIIIDFHNMNKRKNPDPTNHLFLHDLREDSNKLEEVCGYVLSKDRRFIPLSVSCSDKKDYNMIENILKENYGEKGRLNNGFLGIGWLGNIKNIKGRIVKELSFGNYVQRAS